jgi:hypothetical protein
VAEGRPKLEVVSGGSGAEAPAAAPAPERRGRRGRLWALLVVLALLAALLQTWRAVQLGAEVSELRGQVGELVSELAEAEAALSAHRRHLDEVRSAVGALSELVSREPEPAVEAAEGASAPLEP